MARSGWRYPWLLLVALTTGAAGAEEAIPALDRGDPDTPVLHTDLMDDAIDSGAAPGRPERRPGDEPPGAGQGRAGLSGEFYAGLLGGNVEAAATTVNGTYQCFFCSPVSDAATTSLGGGGAFGVRGGFWGTTGAVNPGLAFEASGAGVSGDRVSLHYQGFGFAPMVRIRLLRSAAVPEGRFAPYAGFMLFRLLGGNMEVNLPALPRPLSGTPTGMANGLLIGLAVRMGEFEVGVEARKVNVDVSLDSMAGDKADFRADSTQMFLVINYRFSH